MFLCSFLKALKGTVLKNGVMPFFLFYIAQNIQVLCPPQNSRQHLRLVLPSSVVKNVSTCFSFVSCGDFAAHPRKRPSRSRAASRSRQRSFVRLAQVRTKSFSSGPGAETKRQLRSTGPRQEEPPQGAPCPRRPTETWSFPSGWKPPPRTGTAFRPTASSRAQQNPVPRPAAVLHAAGTDLHPLPTGKTPTTALSPQAPGP